MKPVKLRKSWKSLVAILVALVYLLILCVGISRGPVYLFLTFWILILFTLYLVAYALGWTTPRMDATIFTLVLFMVLGFCVTAIMGTMWNGYRQFLNQLLIRHLIPLIVLIYLNGLPHDQPDYIVIFSVILLYMATIYIVTGHNPLRIYGLHGCL